MENLIYILIGIAWVAYSVYSARQKAIQKQQSAGMPPSGPSQSSPLPIPGNQTGGKNLLDEILRELSGEPRTVAPVSQPVIINQPAVTKQPVKEKQKSEYNQKYEGYSGYEFVPSVSTDFPRNEEDDARSAKALAGQLKKDEPILKGFNLREAVIYSELLNPKYFWWLIYLVDDFLFPKFKNIFTFTHFFKSQQLYY